MVLFKEKKKKRRSFFGIGWKKSGEFKNSVDKLPLGVI